MVAFALGCGLPAMVAVSVYSLAGFSGLGGRLLLGVLADRLGAKQVLVNMGLPNFEPAALPFTADARALAYPLQVGTQCVTIGAVSMGNPHAVIEVESVDDAPVEKLGPAIERHARFPKRVNVGFMQIVDRSHVRLRVFERGAGETLACGTGACAAVAVGRAGGRHHEKVEV